LHDYKDKSTIGGNSIYDLFIDSRGNFWVGVDNGGLNLFNSETGSFYTYYSTIGDARTLSGNSVTAIYEDNVGSIWVGVYRGGVNFYNPNHQIFRTYTANKYQNSVSNNSIKSFLED